MLGATTLAFRPLLLREFSCLAKLPADFNKRIDYIAELIRTCGFFLTVRDKVVYFIHQLAKNFLSGIEAERIFQRRLPEEHYIIALYYLETLSQRLKKNVY
jgi:hypothetical protein